MLLGLNNAAYNETILQRICKLALRPIFCSFPQKGFMRHWVFLENWIPSFTYFVSWSKSYNVTVFLFSYSFLLKIYTKVAVAKIGYCGIIQGRLTWICFSSTRFQWIFLEQLPKSTYLLVLLIYIWCIYLLKVWHFSCWIRNLIYNLQK